MSRYDHQRERKRLLIVGTVIVLFFAGVFVWVQQANSDTVDATREVEW